MQFVSKGKYDDDLEQKHTGGYTCWGMGDGGTIQSVTFEDMDAAVKHLVDDNLHPG